MCRDSLNNPIPEMEAVAGLVTTVNINLSYDNIGEDPAFGSEISFTIPERFVFFGVPPGSSSVSYTIPLIKFESTCI